MPKKSKASELYERITNGSIDNYFNKLNDNEFTKLATAIADEDIDIILSILRSKLKKKFSGFDGAIDSSYDAEMMELAKRILENNSTAVRRRETIEKEPETEEVVEPPIEEEIKKPVEALDKRTGKRYRRSLPQKFTKRELKFFERRAEKTGREVYNDYIEAFGNNRTFSSVTTKFYRVRR